METTALNLGITLSDEDMSMLKGGVAEVTRTQEEASNSGDGAEYICCIKIKWPLKSNVD